MAGVGGAAHPDELRKRLSSRQIAEWIAYANIEPFGAPHEELLHGIRCLLFAAANHKDGTQEPTIYDFCPSLDEPEMTPEQIARNIQEWKALIHGGSGEA